MRTHLETFTSDVAKLTCIVSIEIYFLFYLLLFADGYLQTSRVPYHLSDHYLIFSDGFLELGQHRDSFLFDIFVLTPVDHVLLVLGEISI